MEQCSNEDQTALLRLWIGICMGAWGIFVFVFFCSHERPRLSESLGRGGCRQQTKPEMKSQASHLPDLDAARRHLAQTSCTDANGKWLSVAGTSLQDIGSIGGPGLELYFRALKNMGLCFCYMTLTTAPLMIFNTLGNSHAEDGGLTPARIGIGNLGNRSFGNATEPSDVIMVGCEQVSLEKLTQAFALLDLVSVLLFLGTVLWFRFKIIPRIEEETDARHITPADFAVQLVGLPSKSCVDPDDEAHLKEFVEKLVAAQRQPFLVRTRGKARASTAEVQALVPSTAPQVCEVSLVRNLQGTLSTFLKRAETARQQTVAQDKGNHNLAKTLGKKIEMMTRKLAKVDGKSDADLPILRAYVLLDTAFDKEVLINTYAKSQYRLFRNSCCLRRELQYRNRWLRVTPAPEPTDILWENADVTWYQRGMRLSITSLLCLLFLVASFIFLDRANALRREIAESGAMDCEAATTAETDNFESAKDGGFIDCFCAKQGYQAVLEDDSLRDVCSDWLTQRALVLGIGGLAALIIVVINMILRGILVSLARWERPPSVSSLEKSIMVKVAVAQTVNTAFVTLITNSKFSLVLKGFEIGGGKFSDFERDWYLIVGASLTITMVANVFSSSVLLLLFQAVRGCRRRCCASRVKHQQDLLTLFTNPDFSLSARFAQLLTTVFCTLMFSSGLPGLNLLACLFCAIAYWCDKYALFRGSRKPPIFDARVAKQASELMLHAAVLHCVFAVAMFGRTDVFPSQPTGGVLGKLIDESVARLGSSHSMVVKIKERSIRNATLPFVLLGIILIVFPLIRFVLLRTLKGTLGTVVSALATAVGYQGKTKRGSLMLMDQEMGHLTTFTEVAEEIERLHPPASYKLDRHPRYQYLKRHGNAMCFQKSDEVTGEAEIQSGRADHEKSVVAADQGETMEQARPDGVQSLDSERPRSKSVTFSSELVSFALEDMEVPASAEPRAATAAMSVEPTAEVVSAQVDALPAEQSVTDVPVVLPVTTPALAVDVPEAVEIEQNYSTRSRESGLKAVVNTQAITQLLEVDHDTSPTDVVVPANVDGFRTNRTTPQGNAEFSSTSLPVDSSISPEFSESRIAEPRNDDIPPSGPRSWRSLPSIQGSNECPPTSLDALYLSCCSVKARPQQCSQLFNGVPIVSDRMRGL